MEEFEKSCSFNYKRNKIIQAHVNYGRNQKKNFTIEKKTPITTK